MATLGPNVLTLIDWAKRKDPDGKIPAIAELLSQTNEVLDDMLFKEGNLEAGHMLTVRTGLPTVAWRLLNQGVAVSKSTTAQITEQTGMLEAWSEVDKDLCELNGNAPEFRLSEASAFLEAMSQEMSQTLFYGNSGTAPEEFTGLSIRYSSLSATNASNIVSGSGSGSDNTSIWLVVWGENSVHGIFPKASQAGIMHEDLGLVTVETTAGVGATRMRAYQDHWQWKAGIAVKDWRYIVRIPNIDVSNLTSESSAADLTKLMIKAIHRIPNLAVGKAAFYMNRTVAEMLDIQRLEAIQAGGALNYDNVDGKRVMYFRGIPIRTCDAILETESAVS